MGSKRSKKVKSDSETSGGLNQVDSEILSTNNENTSQLLNTQKSKKKKKVIEQDDKILTSKPLIIKQKKTQVKNGTSVLDIGNHNNLSTVTSPEGNSVAVEKKKSRKKIEQQFDESNTNNNSNNTSNHIDQVENPSCTSGVSFKEEENNQISDINLPSKKRDLDWPEEDLNELIMRMQKSIPENDILAYSTRAEKLNWNEIAFKKYSGDDCKKTWNVFQKHIRRFRLLSEVLSDAKEWLKTPHFKKAKKRHPDMPRRARSSYMIFFLKKKNKILSENPGIDAHELARIAATYYKALTPEKREKYERFAAAEKQEYESKIQQFYELHPELRPKLLEKPSKNIRTKPSKQQKSAKVTKISKPPKTVDVKPEKPKTPFQYFLADELKNVGQSSKIDKNVLKDDCKERWKNMSDKKKVFYINWAERCQTEYEEQVKTYVEDHPTFIPQQHKNILTKEEKLLKERIAGKPVKPPNSAYSLFSKKFLLSQEIKSVDPKERMNYVSIKWKHLSDDDKKEYQEEVTKLMAEYKVAFDAYIQSLPEEKRKEELEKMQPKRKLKIADENSENKEPPKKKKRKKSPKPVKLKFKEPEQPPISAYKYFLKSYQGENPSSTWKTLDSIEKKKYEDELMERKREYIDNFEKFLKSLTKEQLEEYSKTRKQLVMSDGNDEDDECSNCSSGSEASEENDNDFDSE